MEVWTPARPLTLAETHVDFQAHHQLIRTQRARVEEQALPVARRVAIAAVDMHGYPPQAVLDQLEQRFAYSLAKTARFGYTEARQEIGRQRAVRLASYPGEHPSTLAALAAAVGVKVGVSVHQINDRVAKAVKDGHAKDLKRAAIVALAVDVAQRALHNSVLELVGQTLNLGRDIGATTLPDPPQLAMRSEQLDPDTCDACDELHGTVVEVNSPEYDDTMPPAGCYGGGRCRGIYVYADDQAAVELPAAA
jgi:hypothetical protein